MSSTSSIVVACVRAPNVPSVCTCKRTKTPKPAKPLPSHAWPRACFGRSVPQTCCKPLTSTHARLALRFPQPLTPLPAPQAALVWSGQELQRAAAEPD